MNYSYLIFIFFPLLTYGQSVEEIQNYSNEEILELVMNDSIINSHYSDDQIQEVYKNDIIKLYSIYAYYHASFVLEPMETNRETVSNKNFLQYFDISRYEHLREVDNNYHRDFEKYGLKLELYSTKEWEAIKNQMNQILTKKKLEETLLNHFPNQEEMNAWILQNPDSVKKIISNKVKVISIKELNQYSKEKQEKIKSEKSIIILE